MSNKNNPIAIIDIGSSSVRLVIFDEQKFSASVIFNEKVTLNLGKGIFMKRIDESELQNLIKVLKRFFHLCKNVKKKNLHIFGSAALRLAENQNLIVKKLKSEFNHDIRVLTGEEEGELSAKGVFFSHHEIDGIVGDFGGGSLELTEVNTSKQIKFIESLIIGHVVLKKIGNFDDKKVRKYIEDSIQKVKLNKYSNFYAVGGSFRALAKLHMHIKSEDLKIIQDYKVDSAEFLHELRTRIFVNKNTVDEKFLSQLFKSRIKSIPYTFHVLEMLVQKMSIKKIFFTNTGVREGVLYDLVKDKGVDPFLSQIRKIARGTIKKRNAEKLFSWILPFNDILKMDQNLLLSACWLTNIASPLHPEHRRIFALEKILYHQFFHLDRQNRIMLALILYFRYSNNLKENFALSYSEKISKKNLIKVKILGQLLRMAHHITGRLNYNNLDHCKLTINSINEVNFKAKKTYLLFGQSFERGIKNISNAFESLKRN